ncbi:MAG: EamA family transporter [bacterium]
MTWAFLTLATAFLWALTNINDKIIQTKWVKEPMIIMAVVGGFAFFIGFIVWIIIGFKILPLFYMLLSIGIGIFSILNAVFYFKAVKLEEISRVAPLFYLSPLFTLILAAIFLGEIFTPLKYLGIILLIIGAVLISVQRSLKYFIRFNKAFYFMIISAFVYAVESTTTKFLVDGADYWTIFVFISFGVFFGSLPIIFIYSKNLTGTIKKYGVKVIGLATLSEFFGTSGWLLFMLAATLGPITLVNSLAATQMVFVLILTITLSVFWPRLFAEKISPKIIGLKLMAIVLIIVGAYLII